MTIASRTFAAMLKIGPATTTDIAVERDVAIPAPDNARLLTDVYLAKPDRPRPVILLRSPYGRGGVYGTMARLFAERGYHAAVQSTRGTFGSEGRIDFDQRQPTAGRRPTGSSTSPGPTASSAPSAEAISVSPSSPSPPPGRLS